jgi:hypothetical protein
LDARAENRRNHPFGEPRKKNGRGMEVGFLWKENGDHTDAARMSTRHQNKNLEWNLNDWRWDTNLFLATPSSTAPLECGGRDYIRSHVEIDFGVVDKRRRVSPEDNSAECSNVAATNGDTVVVWLFRESRVARRRGPEKVPALALPHLAKVDGCQADLCGARDYHKRHKVCEAHTKSSVVCIKSVEHRFYQ